MEQLQAAIREIKTLGYKLADKGYSEDTRNEIATKYALKFIAGAAELAGKTPEQRKKETEVVYEKGRVLETLARVYGAADDTPSIDEFLKPTERFADAIRQEVLNA